MQAEAPDQTRCGKAADDGQVIFMNQRLIGRLVRLPLTILGSFEDAFNTLQQADAQRSGSEKLRVPNSIDNLKSSDPFVMAAASLPVAMLRNNPDSAGVRQCRAVPPKIETYSVMLIRSRANSSAANVRNPVFTSFAQG